MPSPRLSSGNQRLMLTRTAIVFSVALAGLLGNPAPAAAQISMVTNLDGRRLFVNTETNNVAKLTAAKPPATISLSGEISFMGRNRPSMSIDRGGVEKLVREAAERHHVDPALVRAVIQTESNWNPGAMSRKGAVGLMQLIPTTAQRFGAS